MNLSHLPIDVPPEFFQAEEEPGPVTDPHDIVGGLVGFFRSGGLCTREDVEEFVEADLLSRRRDPRLAAGAAGTTESAVVHAVMRELRRDPGDATLQG